MCGITGFIDIYGQTASDAFEGVVRAMSDCLVHRGPDSDGVWCDKEQGVALGHRRLAIIDLNETGHQPMISHSGRYVIVFNGEIYNFQILKDALVPQGHKFKGGSDTEVLLAAIEEWGLAQALEKINGMFAFAIWDRQERCLYLARDRIGKKPLYYGWLGGVFVFASELRALRKHPGFVGRIDRQALATYCRHNYVPSPWSIYEHIYKLPAAAYAVLPFHGEGREIKADKPLDCAFYWGIQKQAEQGIAFGQDRTDQEWIDGLDGALKTAVGQRMISDVPLGAFLSGGIDSSLIVAMMQQQSSQPVKTFSIGLDEEGHNEAEHAKEIARYLGTEHTEFYIRPDEVRDVIPLMPSVFDEPFADPSQIPTYHVCRLAKEHVTVALSGDGGDESFAGYTRYIKGQKLDRFLNMPGGALLGAGGGVLLDAFYSDGRHEKLSRMLREPDMRDWYRTVMSYWMNPEALVMGAPERAVFMADIPRLSGNVSPVNHMMFADVCSYLPDDILVKIDRTSMAVSLEARAPLLDYKVMEYAWQVPLSAKIKGGQGKWILRQLLARYIPQSLFDRPKRGFGIPLSSWLRGPLRDWCEGLLNEERLIREGNFNAVLVREKWQQHISGKANHDYSLWSILMFQAWQEEWGKK
ncbi:MAG: asparagine synthase (glutamine-hydrolyzing) [Rhodospirillales bacterium]|nr:asparagine synthase (glutamine-hydrolyzing) [Rhodospirillales bacterium]